ncbi:MAG: hypothetical protein LH629_10705, partial [Ignavibacteria bacterium]|nr:hypothetical protein [Ignavibacteria bacterium]
VDSKSRMSIKAYSNAHINFLQKNFEKTLELCNEINFNDLLATTNENLYFKNDIKKIMLISLYELDSFESAFSIIDAHKHFLSNSKLLKENQKEKIMLFLNFVNDMIKLKINFDDFKLIKLKEKATTNKELIYKEWILNKLDDIKPDKMHKT